MLYLFEFIAGSFRVSLVIERQGPWCIENMPRYFYDERVNFRL